jgi:hypothetical protein
MTDIPVHKSGNGWPADAGRADLYMCFTPDHDEDDAAEAFQRRHQRPPKFVFEAGGYLRLGPVPHD